MLGPIDNVCLLLFEFSSDSLRESKALFTRRMKAPLLSLAAASIEKCLVYHICATLEFVLLSVEPQFSICSITGNFLRVWLIIIMF